MQTTKRPYELLIRWSAQGALAGAHVQHRYVIEDGGAIVGESIGPAEPVSLDPAGEFPLAQVMNDAQASAIATAQALQSANQALTEQIEILRQQLESLSRSREAA